MGKIYGLIIGHVLMILVDCDERILPPILNSNHWPIGLCPLGCCACFRTCTRHVDHKATWYSGYELCIISLMLRNRSPQITQAQRRDSWWDRYWWGSRGSLVHFDSIHLLLYSNKLTHSHIRCSVLNSTLHVISQVIMLIHLHALLSLACLAIVHYDLAFIHSGISQFSTPVLRKT